MSYISVDIESDGPIIGENSMVCFGAVVIEPSLSRTFYGKTRPISDIWVPEALAVSGFSREEHERFPDPVITMTDFANWIKEVSIGNPIYIADNNGYDASWTNYYFLKYYGSNPFGWSSRRVGDLYCGLVKDAQARWKHLRKTTHTHNPVDDAMGNAEAVLEMQRMGLKIKLR